MKHKRSWQSKWHYGTRRGIPTRCRWAPLWLYCHAMRVLTRLKKYSNLTQIPRHNRSFQSFEFQVFNMIFFSYDFFSYCASWVSTNRAGAIVHNTRECSVADLVIFFFRLRAQRLSQKQRSLFAFSVHERNSSNMKKKKHWTTTNMLHWL